MQNKEELFEELDSSENILQEYLGLTLKKFLIIIAIIIAFGIYISNLLFGTNSLEVLLRLDDYEEYLQTEIVKLKNENAKLQREYFEQKEISAQ